MNGLLPGLVIIVALSGMWFVYGMFYSWGEDEKGDNWDDNRDMTFSSTQPTAGTQRPDEPILPISPLSGLDPQKVALGQILFHDVRLSRNGTISCATCHDLMRGGVDHLPRSFGVDNAEGSVNTPTVYNSVFNFRQFWDGRAATLEEQVEGPLLNPVEMATDWRHIITVLSADAQISARFRAIYNTPPTQQGVQEVIAEFERSLVTPSRVDRWLRGDGKALSEEELAGYQAFKRHGCMACHQGENVGGNLFQRFGIMQDYFAGREASQADLGRFNVTGREEDRYVFKVPSLRNVAITAPYFHDASVNTLEEAVAIMGRYQLGVDLPREDVQAIVLFLHALTGERLQ
ncbi:MAG: cytochrome-c peroxidase [Zoogloeaceae bacterium]|jgi:cytochrome c peroxidase|nr:cytochrome-c peroxidase [Zoogloeaceae bacterium]